MTLPDERYRAVRWAREFLYDLCDAKKTPGVPKAVRQQAGSILRHYPDDWHMNQAAEAVPSAFQQQMEPVTRLFQQYQQSRDSKDNND